MRGIAGVPRDAAQVNIENMKAANPESMKEQREETPVEKKGVEDDDDDNEEEEENEDEEGLEEEELASVLDDEEWVNFWEERFRGIMPQIWAGPISSRDC